MKIAIPTKNNNVDDHFGHCEAYSIFTINDISEVEKIEIMPSPQGCGCKSNIAEVLQEKGVTILLAGNMGAGALSVLNKHNIKVFRGNTGDVEKLTQAYLQGRISDSGIGRESHEHHNDPHHVCSHDHDDKNKGFSLA